MSRSYGAVAADTARDKEKRPEVYCPQKRCLWRTGGGHCPRHKPRERGVIQISKTVNSMELAHVTELTKEGESRRRFGVLNDNETGRPADVFYATEYDTLYCSRCNATDDCTHTARVRLCGVLSDSVKLNAGIMMVKRTKE